MAKTELIVWKVDYLYRTENSYPEWLKGTSTFDTLDEARSCVESINDDNWREAVRLYFVITRITTDVHMVEEFK